MAGAVLRASYVQWGKDGWAKRQEEKRREEKEVEVEDVTWMVLRVVFHCTEFHVVHAEIYSNCHL